MIIYISLFLVSMILVFARPTLNTIQSRSEFYFFGFCLAIIVGLRYEVGVDWETYLIHLNNASDLSFTNSMNGKDPGYAVFNWIASELSFGVWFVNLLCSCIFFGCLLKFAVNLPNPWLVLTLSIPYLIVVFSMNYTRQSVAFAFLLVALLSLEKQRFQQFIFYIIIGALFHKTVILLLGLALFFKSRNFVYKVLLISFAGILGFNIFLAETFNALVNQYITEEMSSSGALVRVLLCSLPATIFILLRKKFEMPVARKNIVFLLSVASLLCIPLVIFTPYSTFVDRFALYLIPVQLYIYSYLPRLIQRINARRYFVFFITVFYLATLVLWLINSQYAEYWIPYHFYPFQNQFYY